MDRAQQDKKAKGHWVQTERKAHEAWAVLIRKSPLAAQVMHILTSRIGEHNAVVISQKNLARLVEGSERGVRDALALLKEDNWIEVRQIGGRGTVNAHIVNDRVAWSGKRDGIRYSLFSANVILSDDEQPDVGTLDHQEPLRKLPQIGERQLPTGEGLPPPSQPFLDGLETDLPEIPEIELGDFEELFQGNDGKWYIKKTLGQRAYNDDGTYELLGAFITTTELTPQEIQKRNKAKRQGGAE